MAEARSQQKKLPRRVKPDGPLGNGAPDVPESDFAEGVDPVPGPAERPEPAYLEDGEDQGPPGRDGGSGHGSTWWWGRLCMSPLVVAGPGWSRAPRPSGPPWPQW